MTDPRLTPETITLYGTGWCPDCKQSKQFFGEQRIQYHYVDIDEDTEALLFVEKNKPWLPPDPYHCVSRWNNSR